MYNIDFTEYDRTFSKNAVILEKCSFRDNVTIRLYYGMLREGKGREGEGKGKGMTRFLSFLSIVKAGGLAP